MPQRPRNLVWGLLRRLYNVSGQRTTPLDIEYDLPVQVVHDVSREAELGTVRFPEGKLSESGSSTFFTITVSQQTVGAATLAGSIGVYSNQTTSWALATWIPPNPAEETVWVYAASVQVPAAATLVGAEILLDMQPKAGAGQGFAPLMLFEKWDGQGLTNGVSRQGTDNSGIIAPPYPPGPFPLLNKIATATPVHFNTASAAGALVDYNLFCMRLPLGVFPPGLR